MKNLYRTTYFDFLNVLSCMAVVLLHSNGYIHSFIKDDYWGLHVGIETLFVFAVPVFFMLSGATLLNYRARYTTDIFITKRFTKAFLPFLLWGTLFSLLFFLTHKGNNQGFLTWRIVLSNFITGNIPFTNYWFFIPLFFLYAFIPFLSLMIKSMTVRHISYLCIIMSLFQSFIPTLFIFFGIDSTLPLPLTGYLLYALLGYCFSVRALERNNSFLIILCIAAIFSLVVRFVLLYHSDARNDFLFNYFGLYALLPACSLFLIAKRILTQKNSFTSTSSTTFAFLASKSYGVFLLHTFFIRLFDNCTNLDMNDPLFIPTAFCFSYIISITIVIIFQKNKITKYLTP